MKGTIINFTAIFLLGSLGFALKGGIPDKINKTIMHAMALAVIVIGISGSLQGENTLLMVVSLALGALMGELIDIDKGLETFAKGIEHKFKRFGSSSFAEGFITSSLLFCVGTMAIVGSFNSGLLGNHEILYTKSVIDGITALIFSSTLGIGVIFSSFAVLLYQGIITLCASLLKGILTSIIIQELTAVGSVLILALGLNMLGLTKIKVANLLPAVLFPVAYYLIFT